MNTIPIINVPEKCEGCGSCCINILDNKWIEVTIEDAENISLELLQKGDIREYAMKQDSKGRCICLDTDNRCKIYDTRPSICREVQNGDGVCIQSLTNDKVPEQN